MRFALTRSVVGVLILLSCGQAAHAEVLGHSTGARAFTSEEIAKIPMPDTRFDMRSVRVGDFEKYYYFHRDGTSFEEAFADISECDELSSGFASYRGNVEPYPGYYSYQYGIGGVVGGLFGSMLADAIHGSAARREMRRINMRNCMGYKGYQRYGISKEMWNNFNFEEGSGRKDEDVRDAALLRQARVASGPKPTTKVLER